jgi:8-oxo-dGTP pyrophosphatase MutT (NUDIX family)
MHRADRATRRAARVALLDDTDSMFLLRYDDEQIGPHWAMPGGGSDPGETAAETALRELEEETGWSDVQLGPELWIWEHDFTFRGVPVHQIERIFLAHGPRREPTGNLHVSHERDGILAWRWWTPDDIAHAVEALWPAELPTLIARLRTLGAPASPIDLRVESSPQART